MNGFGSPSATQRIRAVPGALVEVSGFGNYDAEKRCHPKVAEYVGVFLRWGQTYDEFENGPGNFTVGIVQKDDGGISLVPPDLLRFFESGQKV